MLSQKQEPEATKQFFEWNSIKSCVIIANDNELSEISDFLQACQQQQINTEVIIIYNGKPEMAPNPSYKHLLLNNKQFNFFGIPKTESLHPISNITYDVLINLGTPENTQAFALSKLINAKCKIATYTHKQFDLTINVSNNIKTFLAQTIVYLQMIKT